MVAPVPTLFPEFHSSRAIGIPGQTPPGSSWIKRHLSIADRCLGRSAAKTTAMFSTKYSLFLRHLSAPILCSKHLPASFLQN